MLKLNNSFRKVMIKKLENQQSTIDDLKSFFEENKLISEEEIKEFETIKDNIINDLSNIGRCLKIESEYAEYKSKEVLE